VTNEAVYLRFLAAEDRPNCKFHNACDFYQYGVSLSICVIMA